MAKEGIYEALGPDTRDDCRGDRAWIVAERQEVLAETAREAERIVTPACERQEPLVCVDEVTKQPIVPPM